MMNKVYKSKSNNPYFNIALECYLLNNQNAEVSLYLWQNDSSVIMGRNQNIYEECDIEYIKNNNIFPVRRFSGGGAVFHDMGNLNFTFLTSEGKYSEKEFISVIKNAISALGIKCEYSGRNDILANGKKFSGQAYLIEDGKYLYHGTIMVNVNFEKLSKALTPSKVKLSSKGIKSVRSRVINLSEADSSITVQKVSHSIENEFIKTFGKCVETVYLDENLIDLPLQDKLRSSEWIYGDSPSFDIMIEKKFSFGNVTANINVACGKIGTIKIYTDSLADVDFTKCEQKLRGKLYDEEIIFNSIKEYYCE